jgi:hypothetical protein
MRRSYTSTLYRLLGATPVVMRRADARTAPPVPDEARARYHTSVIAAWWHSNAPAADRSLGNGTSR